MAQSKRTLPHVLSQQILAQSRLFTIEERQLRFSNENQRTYERLISKGQGAVLIVPVTSQQELLLIREYSAGLHNDQLAFAKGKVDPGETMEQAAIRECQEEIGFQPQTLTLLKVLSTAPSYMNHQIHAFLAQDLVPSALDGDEPEPLEVVKWPLTDWEQLLQQPDFTEARSIAALMLALQHLPQ